MNNTQHELIPAEEFIQQLGISRTTFWRWRKRGWLKTVIIGNRQYLAKSEIERFNKRAEAGQFARTTDILPGGAK